MKKTISLILAVAAILLSPVTTWAITASEAFASAPSVVFPLLERNARLDMIDYFNSGSSTPSKNKLSGQARITAITDKTLSFAMSGASSYDVIVLPCGGDEIIALIETVATPVPDSNISFYDTDWNKLDGKYLEVPQLKHWLTDEGKENQSMVEVMMPFMLVGYEYDAETAMLTLTNNVSQFLSEDIYSQISPYLRSSLTYKWNGKRFDRVK